MRKLASVLLAFIVFGSLVFTTEANAAEGSFMRTETNTTGTVSTYICEGTTAKLEMEPAGFTLQYAPANCRDQAGAATELTEWVVGALSVHQNGDLASRRTLGVINATGIIYETTQRDGTITKLKVSVQSSSHFSFVLERIYADGFKRVDQGEFRN